MATFPRGVWLVYAALAALLGLQAFLPEGGAPPPLPTPPGAAAAIAVDFVAPGAIEITRVSGTKIYAKVFVRNDSDLAAAATVDLVLLDRHGTAHTATSQHQLPPRAATPIHLQISPVPALDQWRDGRLPMRGYATLRAQPRRQTTSGSAVKWREVLVPQIQPSMAEMQVTLLGLGAGAIVLLFGLVSASGDKAGEGTMLKGTPKWTPQSWSTNLAIGGALLTALLAVGGLPAHGAYATKASYVSLAAFYAALVALAPAVYGLLKVGQVAEKTALRLFALAAGVTVWATVGQLGTAATVVLELGLAHVLSKTASTAAAVLFWSVAAMVVLYALMAVHAYGTGASANAPVKDAVSKPNGPVQPPGSVAPDEWPLL